MSDTTPRTALPLLAAAQSQKHVTHNEALLELDAILSCVILDRDLSAPPGSPADGDTYLVKATGTGDWAGEDGKLAYAIDGGWRFYAPFDGLVAYVADETKLIVYNGSAWVDYASVLALQNVPLLGVNATADSTNKLTVASAALLFDNIGNGVQAKLNKHAATDTASFLLQDNYSGRAEIGLAGDDDLHVKVSADGSSWFEALKASRSTGLVTLVGAPTAASHAATKQYVDRAGARHADVTGSVTLDSSYFGEIVRIDASSGAATVTMPSSATTDDWVAVRKKDSSANRVTVKTSGGTDIAWLPAQHDQAIFAWWGGTWIPVAWSIAPITDLYTSSSTWTKAPLAEWVEVLLLGAGAGGGSGRRGAAGSARAGGQAGQCGVLNTMGFRASSLGATESVTVGAGGAGGAAQTSDSSDGNVGTAGGNSTFGTHLVGLGGNPGAGGSTAASAILNALQPLRGAMSAQIVATSVTAATAATTPGPAAGGGSNGGGISTGNTAFAGAAGANGSTASNTMTNGGTAGATSGGNGGAGDSISDTVNQFGGAGGGGGGGNSGGAGGSAGAGGTPGGGGGGGGASVNGNASGAGGAGARGEVRITTCF
jgi:hypothetical protein